MTSLIDALSLGKGGVISIVGAGGKTSLMFRLARDLAVTGATVMTTTTTKILKPTKQQSPCVVVASDPDEVLASVRKALKRHRHLTAAPAAVITERHKLNGFRPEIIDAFSATGLLRWILVEADGAAGRPLKAPAPYEPVIPKCTGRVIALVGMKGVGRPLTEKWVFRCNRFAGLTGLKCGQTVSPAAVARALTAGNGLFKGSPAGAQRIALLNMADRRHRLTMARRIAWLLRNAPRAERPQRVVVGRILHPEPVIETYDV